MNTHVQRRPQDRFAHTGERAPHGIDLLALDGFIANLAAALRDFDRHEGGRATRKSGTPEAAAIAATALRLVRLEAGSADATLVPIQDSNEMALPTADPPRARVVFDKLMDLVEERQPLPREVAVSLEAARKACGSDGAFIVRTAGERRREVEFTRETLAAVTPAEEDRARVTAISGRLSRLAESPDQELIRAPDGTEWIWNYSEELAPRLQSFWRTAVRATGEGQRTSARKGAFRLTDVELEGQGIDQAQGLDAIGADHLFDDAIEEAYLAAVFGDDED